METMNFKKILSSVAVIAIAISTGACGQDLARSLAAAAGQSSGGNNGSSAQVTDPYKGIDTQGAASNILGSQSFSIDKVTQTLKLSFNLPVNLGGGSMQFNIDEIPGAFLAIGPDPSNGKWTLSFNIPLSHLVKGIGIIGPTTLPNGEALPGVPGGEPPRIAAHITRGNVNIYIYASVKYFGIFVPTHGFNPFIDYSFPLKNKAGNKIMGYFSTVSAQNGFDGGVFLSLVFPPELAAVLDSLFS